MSPFPLYPGCECLIEALGRESRAAERFAQMGILPGSRLRVVRLAPMGDTVEVSVDGGLSIALRAAELRSLDCRITALPLSVASRQAGRRYRVSNLSGGGGFRQRMRQAGFTPGVVVYVGEASGWPLKVTILPGRQNRTLGHGEAKKILVTPLDGDGDRV